MKSVIYALAVYGIVSILANMYGLWALMEVVSVTQDKSYFEALKYILNIYTK